MSNEAREMRETLGPTPGCPACALKGIWGRGMRRTVKCRVRRADYHEQGLHDDAGIKRYMCAHVHRAPTGNKAGKEPFSKNSGVPLGPNARSGSELLPPATLVSDADKGTGSLDPAHSGRT
eukprot:1391304-Amphidinium_carterae.1